MAGHRTQQLWIARGLCRVCGEPRGEDGTKTRCRKHANEHSKRQANLNALTRADNKAKGGCAVCGVKLATKKGSLCWEHRVELANRAKAHRRKHSSAYQP